MPFSKILNTKSKCKESDCKVDRKNIENIFDPEKDFLDNKFKQDLFKNNSYKICDCIIVCKNGDIKLIEILCGTLTYKELKDKQKQLENCYKIVEKLGFENKINKIAIIYKTIDYKNPLVKKVLTQSIRIKNNILEHIQYKNIAIDIGC